MKIKNTKTKNTSAVISLREIKKSDIEFLYSLLQERDPKANISHKKMPSFSNHKKFVLSKPYKKWYIILYNDKEIGSVYLSKQDEIGIFLLKNSHKQGIGTEILNQLISLNPRKRYLANVSPTNQQSQNFFKKNDFKLIQHTFELIRDEKIEK